VVIVQALPDEDDTTENGVCAINIACTGSFMDSFFEQVCTATDGVFAEIETESD